MLIFNLLILLMGFIDVISKNQIKNSISLISSSNLLVPSGLIAIYKPKDYSSAKAVAIIKNILQNGEKFITNEKRKIKVGHGGTLDPLAEGVLVLGVGKGTQSLSQYLNGTKEYKATALLGIETNTLDCTGVVTHQQNTSNITLDMIESNLNKFRGNIKQIPPMFSALKKDGMKLYDLARKGIEVEREPRDVTVYSLDLDSFQRGLPYFNLIIESSGGFYVRTLIADLAKQCDNVAHMTELLRTKQGSYTLEDCLYEKDWEYEKVCEHIKKCSLKVGISPE